MRSGAIREAIEAWLPVELDGADRVRRALALRLADELDAPDVPAHVIPRAVNALGAIVAAIEGEDDPVSSGELDPKALRRLLREVVLQ